jgi:thiamine pyrophosphate-dependent acetolactate synthase large subunit-like protein
VTIPVDKALAAIARHRGDAVVVTTQVAGREWTRWTRNERLDLYAVGCMGKASSIGLGIALARPERRVIVLDGDGSILMNLGSLVTIAHQRPDLVHFVFENGVYETTGGQPLPGEGTFDLCAIAAGAGYPHVYDVTDEAHLQERVAEAFGQRGPVFVRLRVDQVGHRTPVRTRIQQQVRDLMAALAAAAP